MLINCTNQMSDFKIEYNGNFLVLKNFVKSLQKSVSCFETITYTTHGDLTFLDNLPQLIERWEAPISFTLYTPGDDYDRAVESILYLRNCDTQAELIKKFVTFHFFFDLDHLPKTVSLCTFLQIFSSNETKSF